ncbi:MAG: histidinol dehydrogenase, partial [Desulfobacterales bacterium]|nr:histidinol dehydrogenase [Desulfobacterales bacterium]MDX2512762.1 histidinol dehydrogenase [Desulfobacterales bacterium]
MKTYTYPSSAAEKRLGIIENRTIGFKKKDISAVNRILEDVKKNGDKALLRYTHQFDSKVVTKK